MGRKASWYLPNTYVYQGSHALKWSRIIHWVTRLWKAFIFFFLLICIFCDECVLFPKLNVGKHFNEKKKPTFFFSISQAIVLLFVSYLARPCIASSSPCSDELPKNQQTSFLEETFGRDLCLHSWTSKNSLLFLLPLTERWLMLHLPLMWQNASDE